jgi:hypothetical protein
VRGIGDEPPLSVNGDLEPAKQDLEHLAKPLELVLRGRPPSAPDRQVVALRARRQQSCHAAANRADPCAALSKVKRL